MAHVVRNCVDHGLPPQSEHLPGFEPTLRFQVWTESNQLFVEIGDNGRGINWEGLRQSLVRKGHPAETHQDLLDGLFIDGVSAKTEVGETSGRGVGMAAVRQEVLERSGSIEVISAPNQGTRFRFGFPLSASIRAAA
jgi:two-component system chemotaxis sensor kinase CheA